MGNDVLRVDEPAGTNCPLSIVFKRPLHFKEIESRLELSKDVTLWESTDPHYPIEKGFFCQKTHHALSGPLK